tara:strand:- start:429 stop:1133 length:705 start_codon:yes stop_codon:yes gene_type:complete
MYLVLLSALVTATDALAQSVEAVDQAGIESQSFWNWDLSTAIQATIAFGTLATTLIALFAAFTWRAQVRAQHDLELARRIALQLIKCEEQTGYLYFSALESIELASEIASNPEKWKSSLGFDAEFVESAKQEIRALRALELEYRAYWGERGTDRFCKVYTLVEWAIGCHEDVADSVYDTTSAYKNFIRENDSWASYRNGIAIDEGIGLDKAKVLDVVEKFYSPAKALIASKMKL